MIILGIIATYANQNFFYSLIAIKHFKIKFKFQIYDFLTGYNIKNKISE